MLKHRVQHHTIQQQSGASNYPAAQQDQYGKYTLTDSKTENCDVTNQDGDHPYCSADISTPVSYNHSDGRQFAGIKQSHYDERRDRSGSASQNLRVPVGDAEEGVRKITQKYDSVGNLSSSSQKSPTSDNSSFSFTDLVMSQKYREGISEKDLLQVDTFYRSHKSEVYVCACLANLFFGSMKSALNNDQWTFSCTGIPLLLLDTGEHHRERKLFIIVAEKGTGFTLWRDVIDNQTGYRTPNSNFHTMHTSKDHTRLAGFSFDEASAAAEFYTHVHKLTSDPEDDLLKTGNIKKKKSVKDKKKKIKLPKKTEISNPCCFVHVTKLDRPNTGEKDVNVDNQSPKQTEISAPFNFKHVTAPTGTGSDLNNVSNLMGSKLTLTSTSSVDSGLSDDRSISKTVH